MPLYTRLKRVTILNEWGEVGTAVQIDDPELAEQLQRSGLIAPPSDAVAPPADEPPKPKAISIEELGLPAKQLEQLKAHRITTADELTEAKLAAIVPPFSKAAQLSICAAANAALLAAVPAG